MIVITGMSGTFDFRSFRNTPTNVVDALLSIEKAVLVVGNAFKAFCASQQVIGQIRASNRFRIEKVRNRIVVEGRAKTFVCATADAAVRFAEVSGPAFVTDTFEFAIVACLATTSAVQNSAFLIKSVFIMPIGNLALASEGWFWSRCRWACCRTCVFFTEDATPARVTATAQATVFFQADTMRIVWVNFTGLIERSRWEESRNVAGTSDGLFGRTNWLWSTFRRVFFVFTESSIPAALTFTTDSVFIFQNTMSMRIVQVDGTSLMESFSREQAGNQTSTGDFMFVRWRASSMWRSATFFITRRFTEQARPAAVASASMFIGFNEAFTMRIVRIDNASLFVSGSITVVGVKNSILASWRGRLVLWTRMTIITAWPIGGSLTESSSVARIAKASRFAVL